MNSLNMCRSLDGQVPAGLAAERREESVVKSRGWYQAAVGTTAFLCSTALQAGTFYLASSVPAQALRRPLLLAAGAQFALPVARTAVSHLCYGPDPDAESHRAASPPQPHAGKWLPVLQFTGLAMYHGGCIALAVGFASTTLTNAPVLALAAGASVVAMAAAAIVSQLPTKFGPQQDAADRWNGLGIFLTAIQAEIWASLPAKSAALKAQQQENAEAAWAAVAKLEARMWHSLWPSLLQSRTAQLGVVAGVATGLWQGARVVAGAQSLGAALAVSGVLLPLITETSRQFLGLIEGPPTHRVQYAQQSAQRCGLLFVATSLQGIG